MLHGPVPIWGQPNTRSWRGRSRPMAGSPRFVGYSTTALRCPDEENATDDILLTDTNPIQAITITRYAKRMLIENALADAVRFFHIDALSSSVGLKVDFDMALLVLAGALYRLMARRMRGYDDAQARQIFRDLIDMPADVAITENEIRVRFHRRAHLPIVLASGLIDNPIAVPWWNGRRLRLVQ